MAGTFLVCLGALVISVLGCAWIGPAAVAAVQTSAHKAERRYEVAPSGSEEEVTSAG
jgi:hypothetical protein